MYNHKENTGSRLRFKNQPTLHFLNGMFYPKNVFDSLDKHVKGKLASTARVTKLKDRSVLEAKVNKYGLNLGQFRPVGGIASTWNNVLELLPSLELIELSGWYEDMVLFKTMGYMEISWKTLLIAFATFVNIGFLLCVTGSGLPIGKVSSTAIMFILSVFTAMLWVVVYEITNNAADVVYMTSVGQSVWYTITSVGVMRSLLKINVGWKSILFCFMLLQFMTLVEKGNLSKSNSIQLGATPKENSTICDVFTNKFKEDNYFMEQICLPQQGFIRADVCDGTHCVRHFKTAKEFNGLIADSMNTSTPMFNSSDLFIQIRNRDSSVGYVQLFRNFRNSSNFNGLPVIDIDESVTSYSYHVLWNIRKPPQTILRSYYEQIKHESDKSGIMVDKSLSQYKLLENRYKDASTIVINKMPRLYNAPEQNNILGFAVSKEYMLTFIFKFKEGFWTFENDETLTAFQQLLLLIMMTLPKLPETEVVFVGGRMLDAQWKMWSSWFSDRNNSLEPQLNVGEFKDIDKVGFRIKAIPPDGLCAYHAIQKKLNTISSSKFHKVTIMGLMNITSKEIQPKAIGHFAICNVKPVNIDGDIVKSALLPNVQGVVDMCLHFQLACRLHIIVNYNGKNVIVRLADFASRASEEKILDLLILSNPQDPGNLHVEYLETATLGQSGVYAVKRLSRVLADNAAKIIDKTTAYAIMYSACHFGTLPSGLEYSKDEVKLTNEQLSRTRGLDLFGDEIEMGDEMIEGEDITSVGNNKINMEAPILTKQTSSKESEKVQASIMNETKVEQAGIPIKEVEVSPYVDIKFKYFDDYYTIGVKPNSFSAAAKVNKYMHKKYPQSISTFIISDKQSKLRSDDDEFDLSAKSVYEIWPSDATNEYIFMTEKERKLEKKKLTTGETTKQPEIDAKVEVEKIEEETRRQRERASKTFTIASSTADECLQRYGIDGVLFAIKFKAQTLESWIVYTTDSRTLSIIGNDTVAYCIQTDDLFFEERRRRKTDSTEYGPIVSTKGRKFKKRASASGRHTAADNILKGLVEQLCQTSTRRGFWFNVSRDWQENNGGKESSIWSRHKQIETTDREFPEGTLPTFEDFATFIAQGGDNKNGSGDESRDGVDGTSGQADGFKVKLVERIQSVESSLGRAGKEICELYEECSRTSEFFYFAGLECKTSLPGKSNEEPHPAYQGQPKSHAEKIETSGPRGDGENILGSQQQLDRGDGNSSKGNIPEFKQKATAEDDNSDSDESSTTGSNNGKIKRNIRQSRNNVARALIEQGVSKYTKNYSTVANQSKILEEDGDTTMNPHSYFLNNEKSLPIYHTTDLPKFLQYHASCVHHSTTKKEIDSAAVNALCSNSIGIYNERARELVADGVQKLSLVEAMDINNELYLALGSPVLMVDHSPVREAAIHYYKYVCDTLNYNKSFSVPIVMSVFVLQFDFYVLGFSVLNIFLQTLGLILYTNFTSFPPIDDLRSTYVTIEQYEKHKVHQKLTSRPIIADVLKQAMVVVFGFLAINGFGLYNKLYMKSEDLDYEVKLVLRVYTVLSVTSVTISLISTYMTMQTLKVAIQMDRILSTCVVMNVYFRLMTQFVTQASVVDVKHTMVQRMLASTAGSDIQHVYNFKDLVRYYDNCEPIYDLKHSLMPYEQELYTTVKNYVWSLVPDRTKYVGGNILNDHQLLLSRINFENVPEKYILILANIQLQYRRKLPVDLNYIEFICGIFGVSLDEYVHYIASMGCGVGGYREDLVLENNYQQIVTGIKNWFEQEELLRQIDIRALVGRYPLSQFKYRVFRDCANFSRAGMKLPVELENVVLQLVLCGQETPIIRTWAVPQNMQPGTNVGGKIYRELESKQAVLFPRSIEWVDTPVRPNCQIITKFSYHSVNPPMAYIIDKDLHKFLENTQGKIALYKNDITTLTMSLIRRFLFVQEHVLPLTEEVKTIVDMMFFSLRLDAAKVPIQTFYSDYVRNYINNNYVGAKREEYLEAEQSLNEFKINKRDMKITFFGKRELIPLKIDPIQEKNRLIGTRSSRVIVRAMVLKPLETYLTKYWKQNKHWETHTYKNWRLKGTKSNECAKSHNPTLRASVVYKKFNRIPSCKVLNVDMSSFDANVSEYMLSHELDVYKSYLAQDASNRELIQLLKYQLKNRFVMKAKDGITKGIIYGNRISGDYNTSYGNIMQMRIIVKSAVILAKLKDSEWDLYDDGDDCLIFLSSHVLDRYTVAFRRVSLEVGHNPKIEVAHSFEQIEFCQMKFSLIHGEPHYFKNVFRSMLKFNCQVNGESITKRDMINRCKGEAISYDKHDGVLSFFKRLALLTEDEYEYSIDSYLYKQERMLDISMKRISRVCYDHDCTLAMLRLYKFDLTQYYQLAYFLDLLADVFQSTQNWDVKLFNRYSHEVAMPRVNNFRYNVSRSDQVKVFQLGNVDGFPDMDSDSANCVLFCRSAYFRKLTANTKYCVPRLFQAFGIAIEDKIYDQVALNRLAATLEQSILITSGTNTTQFGSGVPFYRLYVNDALDHALALTLNDGTISNEGINKALLQLSKLEPKKLQGKNQQKKQQVKQAVKKNKYNKSEEIKPNNSNYKPKNRKRQPAPGPSVGIAKMKQEAISEVVSRRESNNLKKYVEFILDPINSEFAPYPDDKGFEIVDHRALVRKNLTCAIAGSRQYLSFIQMNSLNSLFGVSVDRIPASSFKVIDLVAREGTLISTNGNERVRGQLYSEKYVASTGVTTATQYYLVTDASANYDQTYNNNEIYITPSTAVNYNDGVYLPGREAIGLPSYNNVISKVTLDFSIVFTSSQALAMLVSVIVVDPAGTLVTLNVGSITAAIGTTELSFQSDIPTGYVGIRAATLKVTTTGAVANVSTFSMNLKLPSNTWQYSGAVFYPFSWYEVTPIPSYSSIRPVTESSRIAASSTLITPTSNTLVKQGVIRAVNVTTGDRIYESNAFVEKLDNMPSAGVTQASKGIYIAPFAFAPPDSTNFVDVGELTDFSKSYAVMYLNEPLQTVVGANTPMSFYMTHTSCFELKTIPDQQIWPVRSVFADTRMREDIFNFMRGNTIICENPAHLALIARIIKHITPYAVGYMKSSSNSKVRSMGTFIEMLRT